MLHAVIQLSGNIRRGQATRNANVQDLCTPSSHLTETLLRKKVCVSKPPNVTQFFNVYTNYSITLTFKNLRKILKKYANVERTELQIFANDSAIVTQLYIYCKHRSQIRNVCKRVAKFTICYISASL